MRAFAAGAGLVATLLGAAIGIARADDPPRLNVGPSCEAAARGAIVVGRDKAACMSDEDAALDVLKQNWSKYPGSDKNQCIGNVRTGGPASYVELLSCLEIMRDAKAIRDTDLLTQGGSAGASTGTNDSDSGKQPRQRRRRGS